MSDTRDMQVSIIIPVYNEEKAIGSVIDKINEVMQKSAYAYEIIIVDDCSTDGTARIVESKQVRLLRRHRRGGSGAARKTGIRNAEGEIIVMVDGDGTYDYSDIPEMLKLFPEYDQIIGARTSEQGYWRPLRAFAKKIICELASYLSKTHIPDLNSGLRAFKRDIMKKFLWAIPDGFSCVSSMTIAFLCDGYAVKWIPTRYFPRIGKSKFNPLSDTYNYVLTVIRLIMYFNPLRIFLPLSFILLSIGIIKSIADRFFFLGRMQLSDIVLILTALLVGILGLLADLIVAQGRLLRSQDERG